ncbi:restriction endonuclease [Xanthomonas campestris pv. zinniae]|nr:restriction endonuclease [Xanthomonas campestris pv. zinniae]
MSTEELSKIIDFSEIESGHKFEQFAEDVLCNLGYEINIRPGQGPDGGRDMVVTDVLEGKLSKQKVRYLVSCKHQKDAVAPRHESRIETRLRANHCDAFIGFYSTHVTQGLIDEIEGLKSNPMKLAGFDVVLIQDADILKTLSELPNGPKLVQRWFPRGYTQFLRNVSESYVFRKRPVMRCVECSLDLLDDLSGIVVYEATHAPATSLSGDPERDARHRYHIHDIRPYCLTHAPRSRPPNAGFSFNLRDLIDPSRYIKRVMEDVKFMHAWPPYFVSVDVFRKWNHLVRILYYFVARGQPTPEPQEMGFLLSHDLSPRWEL